MLSTYYGLATPLISQRFGGEVEKFMGDAIMATFNIHGDQPDHALRAARAGPRTPAPNGVDWRSARPAGPNCASA